MGTPYSTIRTYSRTLLGDFDSSNYLYSDAILNQQINLIVLLLNDPTTFGYAAVGDDYEFTNDLSLTDQGRLALRVALALMMGQTTKFSYKTPILSVNRDRGNNGALIASYQELLSQLEGTSIAFASDNELTAYFQGPTRLLRDINDATIAAY